MTEFQRMVLALFKTRGFDPKAESLLHAAIGVSGEAGELLDAIKKHWAYNKPLDTLHIVEELGDLEFYLEALRQGLGIDREDILAANQVKLAKRYPNLVYSDSHAQQRLDKVK